MRLCCMLGIYVLGGIPTHMAHSYTTCNFIARRSSVSGRSRPTLLLVAHGIITLYKDDGYTVQYTIGGPV